MRPVTALAEYPPSTVRVNRSSGACPASGPGPTPVITSSRVRLRSFEEADLPALMGYRNDPTVARYQSWTEMNLAQAQSFWLKQRTRRLAEPGGWTQLAVELLETGEVIGDCAFHIEADSPRLAWVGYSLAPAFQGRGLATEAVGALVDYAFKVLGMHRVAAHTDARNAASIALLARLGFVHEARFARADWFKGGWEDDWVFARLADQASAPRSS
jgi:RimJ/RimL family protein N-acetyltransferase